MAIQRQPGIKSDTDRLDKKRGAGVSPARFCLLFPRRKSRPAERLQPEGLKKVPSAALPAKQPPGARGAVPPQPTNENLYLTFCHGFGNMVPN